MTLYVSNFFMRTIVRESGGEMAGNGPWSLMVLIFEELERPTDASSANNKQARCRLVVSFAFSNETQYKRYGESCATNSRFPTITSGFISIRFSNSSLVVMLWLSKANRNCCNHTHNLCPIVPYLPSSFSHHPMAIYTHRIPTDQICALSDYSQSWTPVEWAKLRFLLWFLDIRAHH